MLEDGHFRAGHRGDVGELGGHDQMLIPGNAEPHGLSAGRDEEMLRAQFADGLDVLQAYDTFSRAADTKALKVSGRSALRARIASVVWRLARFSSHLPRRTSVMTTAEASK